VVFTRPTDLGGPPAAPPAPPPPAAAPPPAPTPPGVPRIQSVETALLPRLLEPPEEKPPSLAELARRHGLKPAATRPTIGAYIAGLWRYREFIAFYANGRTIASFGAARLGRLWQVLTPLLNAGIYFLIFGVILGGRSGIDNFAAYLCIGIFFFQVMSTMVQQSVQSISGQLGLVRAMQFPRASLPIAGALAQFEALVISTIVLSIVVIATGEPLKLDWVYLVPAMGLLFLFSLGLSLFVARLGAKVADLRQVLPFVTRVWMYASAVLFSVELYAEHLPPWAVEIFHANPMLVYIEMARFAMMEGVPLGNSFLELWLKGGAWALLVLVVGFVYFWRGEAEYGRG